MTDLRTDRDEDLHAIERNALSFTREQEIELLSGATARHLAIAENARATIADYTTGKTMADLADGVKPLRSRLKTDSKQT